MSTNKNTNTQNNNNNQKVIVNISSSSLHEHHKRKPISKPKSNESNESQNDTAQPMQQITNHHIYYPEQSLITNTPHTPIPAYMQSAITNRDIALTSLINSVVKQTLHHQMREEYAAQSVPNVAKETPQADENAAAPEVAPASTQPSETLTQPSETPSHSSSGEASPPSPLHNNPLFQEKEVSTPSSDYKNPLFENVKEQSPTHSSPGLYLPFLPENSPFMENNTNTPHQENNSDFEINFIKEHQDNYINASGKYKKQLKNELYEIAAKHNINILHPTGTSKYPKTIYQEIFAKMKKEILAKMKINKA